MTVHTDAWRTEHEVKGGMSRVSPLVTHVECVEQGGKTKRLNPGDFEPGKFEDREHFPINALSQGDWYQVPGSPAVAAVSNAYFSHALVPVSAPVHARLSAADRAALGQQPLLEPRLRSAGGLDVPRAARLLEDELEPGESATYSLLSYIGPKERNVLAHAAGGKPELIELIDLGFFSAIAKILVAFLLKVHGVIPNWGIAIMVLTLDGAPRSLFPLALPGIRSMIRMRELKPEIDALNEKFKDDAQAKGLAQMELWRKHNVNPLKGCLPQLASMPVWFALYTTLQTAVELYNIPFLWFPDLVGADPLYILPFIIGVTSFLQQQLMPMQGDAGAAEDDAVLHAGDVHGLHAVFAGRPRGIHVHERRARDPPAAGGRAARPPAACARGGGSGVGGYPGEGRRGERCAGSRGSKWARARAEEPATGAEKVRAPGDGSRLLGKGKA